VSRQTVFEAKRQASRQGGWTAAGFRPIPLHSGSSTDLGLPIKLTSGTIERPGESGIGPITSGDIATPFGDPAPSRFKNAAGSRVFRTGKTAPLPRQDLAAHRSVLRIVRLWPRRERPVAGCPGWSGPDRPAREILLNPRILPMGEEPCGRKSRLLDLFHEGQTRVKFR